MDELLQPIQRGTSVEETGKNDLASSPVQSTLDPLTQVEQLLYLGKLPAAVRLAQASPVSPTIDPRAYLLLIRCLLLQGRFRQAESICKTALEALAAENEIAREIRLWHAFLQIYVIGDPTPAITEGRLALEWARSQHGSVRVVAQIQVVLGKALAMAVDWNLTAANTMVEARNLLAQAANDCRKAGSLDESLNALLTLGSLYLMGPEVEPVKAREIFEQVSNQALAENNQVRLADATLHLAELDFDADQDQASGTADNQYRSSYLNALNLYEQAGHAIGPADVLCRLGRQLVGTGFDGTNILQQALELYRQEDILTGILRVQSALGTWYIQQGMLAQSLTCHQWNAEIASEMGFPIGQISAYLGVGDYFFRTAEYARALAFYDQAERLVSLPVAAATIGQGLANAYTLMHLPDRAEQVCRKAISILEPTSPSKRLSLTRFILGQALASKGDWAGAINVWRAGLVEDEFLHDLISQAEKLQNIAQATIMQYYQPAGPPIPASAYEEAMTLYARSIAVLKERKDPQASAIIANTYELQGQTAMTCGYPSDAIRYLEQAVHMYSMLNMGLEVAIASNLLGLVFYSQGNQGYSALYVQATSCFEQALHFFQSRNMRDMSWKSCIYLALTSFHRGRLALTADEQQRFWHDAAQCLEEAGADVDLVRGHFIEVDQVAAQTARLGLVADKEKVYVTAIQLHYHYLHEAVNAFNWLERLKGRAFLDALALTALHPPAVLDTTLIDRENHLMAALYHATTQTEVVDLNEQLHALWDKMSVISDPTVTEYVMLRRGEPVGWKELVPVLQMREEDEYKSE